MGHSGSYDTLPRSGKSTKTTRDSGRSTSPRAVERRRLQNRISQRNHRWKVKKNAENTTFEDVHDAHRDSNNDADTADEPSSAQHLQWPLNAGVDDFDYIDFQNFAPSGTNTPPHPTAINNILPYDVPPQRTPCWSPTDLAIGMPLPTPQLRQIPQAGFPFPQCTCNATTGPCPSHFEHIRSQLLAQTTALANPHQQQQQQSDRPTSQFGFSTQIDPLPTPVSHCSLSKSSEPQPQFPSVHHEVSNTVSKSSKKCVRLSDEVLTAATQKSTSASSTADVKSVDSSPDVHDMTIRFEALLESMRAAGFQDFDRMATAYYTAQFKSNSIPAISQRASRSRRLKSLLQDLQESSGQWPRRESRGLWEGLVETAASLCVEELGSVDRDKCLDLVNIDPGDLLSTLGWLFFSHEHDAQGAENCLAGSNVPQQVKILAEQMEDAQDQMLHLWPLLTELAGPQGLYCDRIAQVALAILLYARRVQ